MLLQQRPGHQFRIHRLHRHAPFPGLPQRSLAPSRPFPNYRNHDASIAELAGFQGIFYLTNGSAAAKVTIAGNVTIELETDDLATVVRALVG
jgi:hypothetical protein